MGKRIISQRRGRGTTTYRCHSFRHISDIKHRIYDDLEKKGVILGRVIDLVNCKGHTAPLAQVLYQNGEEKYILAPEKIRVNDIVESGKNASVRIGNTLPLRNIPEGSMVCNIEIVPGDGGKLCRTAGSFGRLVSFMDQYALIILPSKKQKKINYNSRATIGIVAGTGRKEKPLMKAGKVHHIMRAKSKLYPRTSGVAMNAVDHPFGSGRGRKHAKVKSASHFAPPGRKVGQLWPKRTGRK